MYLPTSTLTQSILVFAFLYCFFFFNDTATTEIYTLSLHDALPISRPPRRGPAGRRPPVARGRGAPRRASPSAHRRGGRWAHSAGRWLLRRGCGGAPLRIPGGAPR